MFGQWVPVHCHVAELDGFSAHADRSELLRWLRNFKKPPSALSWYMASPQQLTPWRRVCVTT
nr:MBL fold metallo-hydrolase RNA specificity domain-containing protein [Hymenobacter qilianensis]